MCLYVDDYGDGVFLASGSRSARKEHRCMECGRTIGPGETYRYWTWAWEGTVDTDKMCAHCNAAIDVGRAITGCPRQWNASMLWDRDPEIGYVANCLHDEGHQLTDVERTFLEALMAWATAQWRDDEQLVPVPTWQGAA